MKQGKCPECKQPIAGNGKALWTGETVEAHEYGGHKHRCSSCDGLVGKDQAKKPRTSFKDSLKILKDQVDEQLEFIAWLKKKGLYNDTESAAIMNKMHEVWKAAKEEKYI